MWNFFSAIAQGYPAPFVPLPPLLELPLPLEVDSHLEREPAELAAEQLAKIV